MRFVTIMLLLSTTPAYAQSIYLTCAQWEQMPINVREMYVAGAFDTLSTVTTAEQVNLAKHYNECVAKARISLHQLAENMKEYAETQPDLKDKPAPGALPNIIVWSGSKRVNTPAKSALFERYRLLAPNDLSRRCDLQSTPAANFA